MVTSDFRFSTDDLNANRIGKLTPQQEQLVESIYQTRQTGAKQTTIAIVVFFFILIVLGVGIEFYQWKSTVDEFASQNLPILGMVVAMFCGLLAVSMASSFIVAQDAKRQHISTVEGVASIYIGQARSKLGHYMRYELTLKRGLLNKTLFRFKSETEVNYFQAGKRYRVYYIKFYPVPIVLSAEEVSIGND